MMETNDDLRRKAFKELYALKNLKVIQRLEENTTEAELLAVEPPSQTPHAHVNFEVPALLRVIHACGVMAGLRSAMWTAERRDQLLTALEHQPGYHPAAGAFRFHHNQLQAAGFQYFEREPDYPEQVPAESRTEQLTTEYLVNGVHHGLAEVCNIGREGFDDGFQRVREDLLNGRLDLNNMPPAVTCVFELALFDLRAEIGSFVEARMAQLSPAPNNEVVDTVGLGVSFEKMLDRIKRWAESTQVSAEKTEAGMKM